MLLLASPAVGERVVSDGSDGPFHPTGSQTINLQNVAPDGVFNYTTIHIPANVTIAFANNTLNTPVFLCATGDVLIEGTINVSGKAFNRTPGPGGWLGGLHSPNSGGYAGFGLSPGLGGPPPAGHGNAGGGAGMATPGLIATSRTGANPGQPGPAIPRPSLLAGMTGGGGSGGGGGGGRLFFGVDIPGGDGGGGAGGLQISSLGQLTITGRLLADGGHGGWAFANVGAHGGPGGGGAGGNIELYASQVTLGPAAIVEAIGGAGGGLSTEPVSRDPFFYSSGANGGQGYLFICAGQTSIDTGATLTITLQQSTAEAPADFDDDGDVDIEDAAAFRDCASGANVPFVGNCAQADFDHDLDVDPDDFGIFQRCFSGENTPADPCCGM